MSTIVQSKPARQVISVFLCGDVMTGRGIDQILPHPCNPRVHERWTQSAMDYVRLAELAHGKIPARAAPGYIWGAALSVFDQMRPDARIINLETSITRSDAYVPKGINYKMSPENAGSLAAAGVDCCVLGNNHVLDWERAGLLDSLAALARLRIKTAGAGRDLTEASRPAALTAEGKGRVVVFSFALETSGVPRSWAAARNAAGVNLLPDLSSKTVAGIARQVAQVKQPGDVIIASIHWGPNWGYEIPESEQSFAHALIDQAKVSAIHGHSSHHPKGIEIYCNRLILYGCGDFLNDYEGISGHEEFRGDLTLMYFANFNPDTGCLAGLELVPLQIRRFQLVPASPADRSWLQQTLERESTRFGVHVSQKENGTLAVTPRCLP